MKMAAGILAYKKDSNNKLKVLLAHPGGPYFKNKDENVWSIPKGELDGEEDIKSAAIREFREEIGHEVSGELIDLGTVKQNSNKTVHAFAVALNLEDTFITDSNKAEVEWPPKSGRRLEIPEVDRAEYFDIETAKRKIVKGQVEFLERLTKILLN